MHQNIERNERFGVTKKTHVMYTYMYTPHTHTQFIHAYIICNTHIRKYKHIQECIGEGKFGYQMISRSFFFIMPVCDVLSEFLYSKMKRKTMVPKKSAAMATHSVVEKGLTNIQKSRLLLPDCRGTTI